MAVIKEKKRNELLDMMFIVFILLLGVGYIAFIFTAILRLAIKHPEYMP